MKWLKTTQHITFAIDEGIARITMNRPEKRNALFPALLQEVHDAMLEADDRRAVSVIILSGAGKDFCAGYDLEGAYSGKVEESGYDPAEYRVRTGGFDDDCWQLERNQHLSTAMFRAHKPVIAKVNGNCLAGGTDLAMMCDMIIAADTARFGFPATRANGSPPNNLWIYHVGPQWAKRMLLTGDTLDATLAAQIGLILDAVPADQLDEEVDRLARRMTLIDADLLSAQKRIVNLAMEVSGAMTMQRVAAEMDARAHLSDGPRRRAFKADIAELGFKDALKRRDAAFGDSRIKRGGTPKEST
jgi:enoyl-CoA hydratase